MTMFRLSLLILAIFNFAGLCPGQEDVYNKTEQELRRLLASMSSALKFMSEELDQLNLDAVIGLRLVEGQLSVLLSHLRHSGRHLPTNDILQAIDRNRELAGVIGNKSIPFIQKHQPDYYKNIGFIIQDGFWEHDYASRDLDLHHVRRPTVIGEAMHEVDSDHCIQELRTDRKQTDYKCMVSESCWKLMTSPGYRYYSLSHEVFYLLVGESTGCFHDMPTTIERLSGQFCASMLIEAKAVAAAGYRRDRQDIFMEDAALCGIYGYRQFFNSDWLDMILSWQRQPRGCWGMNQQEMDQAEKSGGGRVKREERVLHDGCECHRTAVALGALVQYVRYTIEYMQDITGYDFF